jgi:hypothetical protein
MNPSCRSVPASLLEAGTALSVAGAVDGRAADGLEAHPLLVITHATPTMILLLDIDGSWGTPKIPLRAAPRKTPGYSSYSSEP